MRLKKKFVDKNIPVRLRVAGGAYFFTSRGTGISLAGLRDFELTGASDGTTRLVFTDPKHNGIAVENSQRIRVSHLTLDYRYPESFGQIAYAAKAIGNRRIEIPALEDAEKIGAVFSYDPATGAYFKPGAVASHISFEVGKKPTPVTSTPHVFEHGAFARLTPGERLIVFHSRVGFQNAVRAVGKENADITFEALTVQSYPQMGITAAGFRGLHLKNNRVVPRAGAKISGRADAYHVNGMVGDVIIEGNEARGQGDDGLNVRGTDLSLRKPFDPTSPSVTIEEAWDAFTEPGDLVVLQTNGNEPLALVRVVRRTGLVLELDWGSCDVACRRGIAGKLAGTLDADDAGQAAIAFNLSRASTRALVLNNRFSFSAGRGTLVQSPNVVVRRNEYRAVAGAGVLATVENAAFNDGPGPTNVAIVGNSLENVGLRKDSGHPQRNGAIAIACSREEALGEGELLSGFAPVAFRVLVRGNSIQGRGYAGVLATFAREVEVSANTISDSALSWKAGDPAFLKEATSLVHSTAP